MSFDFLNDPLDELEQEIVDEAIKNGGKLKLRSLDEYFQDMNDEYKKLYPLSPAPIFSVWTPKN